MRKKITVALFLVVSCSIVWAQAGFNGLWAIDSRFDPRNPNEFLSIGELADGRYFVLLCLNTRDKKPTWQTAIGTRQGEILFFRIGRIEYKLKLGVDSKGVQNMILSDVSNPDFFSPYVRISSEPIAKLEGTIRGEEFTK